MRYLQALRKAKLEQGSTDGDLDANELLGESTNGDHASIPRILATRTLGAAGQAAPTANVETEENYLNGSGHFDTLPFDLDAKGFDLSGVPEITVDVLAADPHAVTVTQPNSIYCEEYRGLRTHLLRRSKLETIQAVVIASVGLGEGKSITALNLSWLLAQTEGVKALLIDCDLRRPSINSYLGLGVNTGLSDVLDGVRGLTESIVKVNPAGLYLLPGGRARPDVAELISGAMFFEILHEARNIFDYVIIDAPPLGVFTDAAVLINQADAALLVVAANQTSYKDVDRVLESVPRERILGVVLNKSDESLLDSGYYDYRSYSPKPNGDH